MWNNGCIVQLQRIGAEIKLSCSGLILDSHQGLILTHSSVLWPSLTAEHKSMLLTRGYLQENELLHYTALVTIESVKDCSTLKHNPKALMRYNETSNLSSQGTNCSREKADSLRCLNELSGVVKCVWKSKPFESIISRLMPPENGWEFVESSDVTHTDNNNNYDCDEDNKEQAKETFQALPFFLLIKLSNDIISPPILSMRLDMPSRRGEKVVVVGTPFGSLSPEVFMNSVSKGIISNIAGKYGEMLLTDARAIPGTEGGIIYDLNGSVIGLIVASLCWKSMEWIGLSIGCSLRALLTSLPYTNLILPEIQAAVGNLNKFPSSDHSSAYEATPCISQIYCRVALVRCFGFWGSAIVVDDHQGVLLTCGHVVRHQAGKTVTVLRTFPKRQVLKARVVYEGGPDLPYDVALLRLDGPWDVSTEHSHLPIIEAPNKGEAVYAVGHACFADGLHLQPSVTRGVVSKLIYHDTQLVMVQSTCAVHAGASGGPLVNSSGSIVGLLTCNAKDVSSASSYPHINLSIPFISIWHIIKKYLQTNNECILQQLRIRDAKVKELWELKGDTQRPPSKL